MPKATKAITPKANIESTPLMDWEQFAQIDCRTPDGQQARIYAGECQVLDQGRYNKYINEAAEYLKAKYGESVDDMEIWSDRFNENVALRNRAAMLATFRKFEVMNGDGTYHEAPLPREWVEIESFFRMNGKLYREWSNNAVLLNPDLFGISLDDDQKKGLSVSTTWLTRM